VIERHFAAAACIDCTRADPESSVKTQFMAFEDRRNLGSYVVGQNDVCDEDTGFLNIRSGTNRDGEICKFVIKRDILRHFSTHPVDTRYKAYGRTRRVHFTINIDSPEMANLIQLMFDEDRHVVDVYLEKIYGKYFLRNTFLSFSINE